MIDTGVAPVAGLNAADKVINGPDLSFESQTSSTRHLDGYGHGTHLAAIAVGTGLVRSVRARPSRHDRFVGIAPDARIVNVKVAAAEAVPYVSQVIAALEWTVDTATPAGSTSA